MNRCRDEQRTVPGGNVSSGRNLGQAVSLDSTACAEVPGESLVKASRRVSLDVPRTSVPVTARPCKDSDENKGLAFGASLTFDGDCHVILLHYCGASGVWDNRGHELQAFSVL